MAITVTDYVANTAGGIGAYLPDVDLTANSTILGLLIHSASRFVDHILGQNFYIEQTATKYFSMISPSGGMDGGPMCNTMRPFFSPTAIQLAYFENQPLSQWLTLTGDGVTPPTNYYLIPDNPYSYSSAGSAYLKPYWGFNLAHLPSPNTTFLPIAIGGWKTVAITASWGWPAVPDPIIDLTSKLVVRAWRAKEAGHPVQGGSSSLGGTINMAHHFDERDLEMLVASDLLAVAI